MSLWQPQLPLTHCTLATLAALSVLCNCQAFSDLKDFSWLYSFTCVSPSDTFWKKVTASVICDTIPYPAMLFSMSHKTFQYMRKMYLFDQGIGDCFSSTTKYKLSVNRHFCSFICCSSLMTLKSALHIISTQCIFIAWMICWMQINYFIIAHRGTFNIANFPNCI